MPNPQQPQPDADWFEELNADPPVVTEDAPTDFLRRIMADRTEPAAARVAAAKVLMDRGVGSTDESATVALARQVQDLTDEQLDAELARFMRQGTPPPDGGVDAYLSTLSKHDQPQEGDRPLPARFEQEVRRRVARRVRKIAADFDRRVQAATQNRTQQAVASPSTSAQPQMAVVVPLHMKPNAERTVAEQVEQGMIDARRADLPPGQRQHVPAGLDPRALGGAWPSGRP